MRPQLMTSNPKKIAEFKRLGIDAEIGGLGPDLDEAIAHPWFVAAHKAHSSGEGALCEDSRLDVEGAQVGIEARFLMDELPKFAGRRAVFAVCLALCSEAECLVWEGAVHGTLCTARGAGFGFDPFFCPDGADGLTLGELEALGRKDEFSARAKACLAFKNLKADAVFARTDLLSYEGPWQSHEPAKNSPKS